MDLKRQLRGGSYSGSARLISFEINLISKEISRAEHGYMNMHPRINALDPALVLTVATGLDNLIFDRNVRTQRAGLHLTSNWGSAVGIRN